MADGLEIVQSLVERHDVGIFGVEVEQALLVRRTERSPTASRTTIGRKPFCTASTAVARTQPDVVQPVMISVSMRRPFRRGTRSVPKKQEAYFFTSRMSFGCHREPRIDLDRLGACGERARALCLSAQMPASLMSASS